MHFVALNLSQQQLVVVVVIVVVVIGVVVVSRVGEQDSALANIKAGSRTRIRWLSPVAIGSSLVCMAPPPPGDRLEWRLESAYGDNLRL